MPTLKPFDDTCVGGEGAHFAFNCTGGELSHLFVTDLGNQGSSSVLNTGGDTAQQIANLALFSNVQAREYWSGTEFTVPDNDIAWDFRSSSGAQGISGKSTTNFAVGVRPGDVASAAVPVPEPQTLALVLLALGAGAIALKRKA